MFLKIEKYKIFVYTIYCSILLTALVRNFKLENIFLNTSNILNYLIVFFVFLSFLKLSYKIKDHINKNKFVCLILLIVFLIFLFNLFSYIITNQNYFLDDLRLIISNFLTVFLCFYFFIFFRNEKFQIFSDIKAIKLLILLGLIMSMIIVTNSQTFKLLFYELLNFLQNTEKFTYKYLFDDNFKLLDQQVGIYFKVDYPLNSKFVIISILNFFFFFLFYTKKKKFYLLNSIFLTMIIFIYANFYVKLTTILFFSSLFFINFISNYLIRVFIVTLIFLSGFILYHKKTSEIVNINLNKFQNYYHFILKNDFKVECGDENIVEFYDIKKTNYNYWKKFAPKTCKIEIIDKKLSKSHLILTYEIAGYNSRVEQLSEYFENIKFRNVQFFFFGLTLDEYKKLIQNNNFTHNSYLNIFFKYGLIFFLLVYLFFLFLIKKQNSIQFLVLVMFLVSQIFDDYLFGNRFEVSMIFWSMLGGALTFDKNRLKKN